MYSIRRYCELPAGHMGFLATFTDNTQPNLANSMLQLQNMLKPALAAYLFDSYHCIHDHYKRGFDHDGPESYVLSREMQRLSSLLRDLYHETGIHELAIWSDQLKYMGRDIQIGPRRLRYNLRPTHRHNRGLLMPQMAW